MHSKVAMWHRTLSPRSLTVESWHPEADLPTRIIQLCTRPLIRIMDVLRAVPRMDSRYSIAFHLKTLTREVSDTHTLNQLSIPLLLTQLLIILFLTFRAGRRNRHCGDDVQDEYFSTSWRWLKAKICYKQSIPLGRFEL